VSSNPAHDEVYSIQYYVIKFVSNLRQAEGFPGTPISSNNKTESQDITEILLKVALDMIHRPSHLRPLLFIKKSQLILFHINKDHNPFIVINY
jgi:hypothetical protein